MPFSDIATTSAQYVFEAKKLKYLCSSKPVHLNLLTETDEVPMLSAVEPRLYPTTLKKICSPSRQWSLMHLVKNSMLMYHFKVFNLLF